MKTIQVPNGTISLSHSSAKCPLCQMAVLLPDVDDKLIKESHKPHSKGYIRYKCQGCQKFIGVAMAYNGEVQSFNLKMDKNYDELAKNQ